MYLCCSATARDAFCLDYDVVVLSDLTGVGSWAEEDCGYGSISSEKAQIAALNCLYATCGNVMGSEKFLEYVTEAV